MTKIGSRILGFLYLSITLFTFALVAFNVVYAFDPNGTVDVEITAVFDENNTIVLENPVSSTYGQKVAFNGNLDALDDGYEFAFWVVNGTVYPEYTYNAQFTVTSNLELTAVFHPAEKHAVLFMDSNGRLLSTQYVLDGEDATEPVMTYPTKAGYDVATNKWNGSLLDITESKVLTLQYDKKLDLSDLDISLNGDAPASYEYNSVVSFTANAMNEGDVFSHWTDGTQIVSRSLNYKFSALTDRDLTAVYAESAPADTPVVSMIAPLAMRTNYDSFLGQYYMPATGYTLVEFGFIKSQAYSDIDMSTADVEIVRSNTQQPVTNEFLRSLPYGSYTTVRAYAIFHNGTSFETVYSDEYTKNTVMNHGFESGDLSGWNRYMIWKNESGMEAFKFNRAVNDTYFGSNPYGRDGSYNTGVVWSGTSWNQTEERMGHMRSSNFTLEGSGWISFKFGGGKSNAFAYISVRRAADDVEVARFGNPNYNDTAKATTQYGSSISNAEAFMFQYYFDLASLSTVDLGDVLYFTVSETASFNWSITTVDSFVTYYPSAPTPGANQTAVNILPSISSVGSSTNQITNGYFDSGFDGWENPNGTWKIESGKARSDQGGDAALGVLRSSAFNTNGTLKYLRFDWAGRLLADKQIFVSIKEVGTNIEVMRLVRRDNLSGKADGNFDNHIADLTSLDINKEYYLEFADNTTEGWGLSWIDHIRLIDSAEYNPIPSGDRMVSISGLVTNWSFNYLLAGYTF